MDSKATGKSNGKDSYETQGKDENWVEQHNKTERKV